MSFSLKLLGGAVLADERGPLSGPASQRHRLALLALLATARTEAVSRDKLMAALWPEREGESARRLLNQAVHALRQALGADAVRSAGDDLRLDRTMVRSDVAAFEEAVAAGDAARAVALYAGPFLDGFFLDDAPEFERWVDRERERLAVESARVVERAAEADERAGKWSAAADWWKRRSDHDPFDSRVALRLMQALERAGNRAGALQHAAAHQRLLREELELESVPEVEALAERLRREPAPASSALATSAPAAAPLADAPPSSATDPSPSVPVSTTAPGLRPRRRLFVYGGAGAAAAVLAAALVFGGPRASAPDTSTSPQVVDQIARAVARELDLRARGDTATRLAQHRTRSIPAYELYLRGDDPALTRSDSGARRGLEYFRRAVALDSSYAAAWAGVARLTFRLAADGHPDSIRTLRAAAAAAAQRALTLDDSLAEAHALVGVMRAMARDYTGAERHLQRAIALEPRRTRPREWYLNLLLWTGRRAEALAEAERALAIDPLSPSVAAEAARALAANGRCDEALARLETLARLDPPLLRAASIAAPCYDRQGRWADAIALLRPQADRDDPLALALQGYLHGRAGQRAEALAIQDRLLGRRRAGAIGAYHLAFVPAGLGERNEAMTWLERADADGSLRFFPGRVSLTGPPFDRLGGDPRMDRLRQRLGL